MLHGILEAFIDIIVRGDSYHPSQNTIPLCKIFKILKSFAIVIAPSGALYQR